MDTVGRYFSELCIQWGQNNGVIPGEKCKDFFFNVMKTFEKIEIESTQQSHLEGDRHYHQVTACTLDTLGLERATSDNLEDRKIHLDQEKCRSDP